MRRSGIRGLVVAAAIVVVWYVSVLAWASRPLHETLQVGVDHNVQPPAELAVKVECNNAFASDLRSADLPPLPAQPEGQSQLAYPREPCAFARSDARRALAIDTAVVAVAAGALTWLGLRRRGRGAAPPQPAVTPGATIIG